MTSTDDEPIRLEGSSRKKRRMPPFVKKLPLAKPSPISGSFVLALAHRRSADHFAPVAFDDLGTWLYYCASIQSVHVADPNRQRRFVGSFGALHPAYILLGSPDGRWCAYIPEEHALGELLVDADAVAQLRTRSMRLFSCPEATLVALISDADLVANYYANASGLILRDAGVLLGHAALVAAALGLAFRILGSRGAPSLERVVCDLPFRPIASGLAWIGGRGKPA